MINPYSFDWGEVFVDSYNVATNNATLVYNFNFEAKQIEDILSYSLGHIEWVKLNVPTGTSITAIFDLRGQSVSADVIREFEFTLRKQIESLNFSLVVNLKFHK